MKTRIKGSILTTILSFVLFISFSGVSGFAAMRNAGMVYVEPQGNCGGKSPCFSSIQEDIDAAESGHEIRIAQGTYRENITLKQGKGLKLLGGRDATFEHQNGVTTVDGKLNAQPGPVTLQELKLAGVLTCNLNNHCGSGQFCEKADGDCSGTGECTEIPQGFCITVWDPVCGCDGSTYSNSCFAILAGVNVDYPGECSASPTIYISISGDCGGKSPCYDSIQKAIDEAVTGSVILIVQGTYDESIVLDKSKALTLQGGWDSTFTTQSSYTAVNSITISNGTIAVDKFVIQ
jgi:pectin methylesterase-like acyl-CoA thioesterase